MELRRIVISLHEGRRIILYPEGGIEAETLVPGIGWTLGNDYPPDEDLAALLGRVKATVDHAADNLAFDVGV